MRLRGEAILYYFCIYLLSLYTYLSVFLSVCLMSSVSVCLCECVCPIQAHDTVLK